MQISSCSENEFILSQGYKIVRMLGQGSYAKVYLCHTLREPVDQKLACKVVDVADEKAEFVHKFFPRELEILSKLKHPNVIHIYGIYKKEQKFYIFMRYAEGTDLLDYILTKGRVEEARARFWAWQMASALSYMHSQNIVHRDLKCENILLTANSNLKISDFGFGKIVAEGDDSQLSLTWCGSLAYTPPEILELKPYNPKKVDPWSMGVVLYVVLSKSLPFNEKSPRAMVAKQKRKLLFTDKPWQAVSTLAKMSLLKLLEVEPKFRWSADNVLTSTWLAEDIRLLELNLENLKRSSRPLITVDRRRLLAQLKQPGFLESVSSRSRGSTDLTVPPAELSFDFFQDERTSSGISRVTEYSSVSRLTRADPSHHSDSFKPTDGHHP